MTTCTGSFNENLSSKEIQFNLMKDKSSSSRSKIKYKSRSNSQINSIIKDNIYKDDFGLFKFEEAKNNFFDMPKNKNKNNLIKFKNVNRNNKIANFNYKDKIKEYNNGMKKINKIEDECDIIECEDDFECENLIDLIKNVDIHNKRRNNYFFNKNNILKNNENNKEKNNEKKEKEIISNNELFNESYINKDLNMELSISKNIINGSEIQSSTIFENLVNNEKSLEKYTDFENSKDDIVKKNNQIKSNIKENNIDNIDEIQINCYNNKNIHFNKSNNIISNKKEEINHIFSYEKSEKEKNNKLDNDKNFNKIKNKNDNSNKHVQNNEFQNCKIDNNINININNNLNNINNINTINNISTINNNSELNNNNYIDVSNNMTYFLSLEKSHRGPITSIIDKNIFSLKKNSYQNNNTSYNKATNNNLNNSSGINKLKWKLLPRHKYNTQVCKSSNNNQSISLNDENQKNSELTTIRKTNNNKNKNLKIELKNDNTHNENNNLVFTEFKKQKEEQDKKIKNLQDKISSLYKIIKEEKNKELKKDEKISKLEKYMVRNTEIKTTKNNKKLKLYKEENNKYKKALNDIKFVESQKDTRIKVLEEQLENLKKNNKINKKLLMKKNNQIKSLIDSKSKQDELIKKYEILKEINFKNNSTKGTQKINYFENIENISNNLLNHKPSFSVTINNNNNSDKRLSTGKSNSCNKLNKSIILKNQSNSINNNKENKNKNSSNKKKNSKTNLKTSELKKQIYTKNISNFTEIFNIDQESFLQENSKRDKKSYRNINNKIENKSTNMNASSNKSSFNEKNINYNNYCNSLCNKSKNKYSNKISLNRIKMYKYNKYQNLPTNITNQILNKDTKKKESISNNKNNTKKTFSFQKSKKLSKINNDIDLKEIYLKAGGNLPKEENIIEKEINLINNNDMKIDPCDNIFYRNNNNNKTNITNSNNNTTITNNITNLSMSPIILTRLHNIENLSIDEKLNLSGNINNNLSNLNNYLKSLTNDEIEKEKRETNKIYKKLWDEGFLRYEEMCKNKYNEKIIEKEENNKEKRDEFWKLNFGMANELIEININKNDFMIDVKNNFLNNFFERKIYGDNEKKYINENILFLNKEGIIDINRKVNENNINNNEIIIPVLKDIT